MRVLVVALIAILAGGWFADAQNFASYNGVVVSRRSFLRNPCPRAKNCFGDSTLVGYWLTGHPEDKAYDYSGNGRDGVWTGTKAGTNGYYVVGVNAGPWAAHFNGTDDYVTLPAPSITGNLTLSLWFRRVGSGSGTSRIFGWNAFDLEVGVGNTQLLQIYTPTTSWNVTSYVIDTKWHFLAITEASGTLSLYVDSVLLNTYSSTLSLSGSMVLANDYTHVSFLSCDILNVRLYAVAWPVAQIQAIYNAEK